MDIYINTTGIERGTSGPEETTSTRGKWAAKTFAEQRISEPVGIFF